MQDQIHEARAIAHALLRAFPEGPPKCWGETARAALDNALRLCELSSELLPVLECAVAENARLALDAHAQLNDMQTVIERVGEGSS